MGDFFSDKLRVFVNTGNEGQDRCLVSKISDLSFIKIVNDDLVPSMTAEVIITADLKVASGAARDIRWYIFISDYHTFAVLPANVWAFTFRELSAEGKCAQMLAEFNNQMLRRSRGLAKSK